MGLEIRIKVPIPDETRARVADLKEYQPLTLQKPERFRAKAPRVPPSSSTASPWQRRIGMAPAFPQEERQ
jgi:hypothetical protein